MKKKEYSTPPQAEVLQLGFNSAILGASREGIGDLGEKPTWDSED